MRDNVTLKIGTVEIRNFLSYRIESDMYTADNTFSLALSNPETPIARGARCELWINDQLELTGLIDRAIPDYDKGGVHLVVEGRDLMGLLVDSCCEDFIQVQNMTLQALAERLLAKVPFINRKQISYQESVRGNLKKKKGHGGGAPGFGATVDTAQTFTRIEPGQTIFEVLRIFAMSRGLMFWGMPDGTLVFGKPLIGGEASFFLRTSKQDPGRNNVLSGAKEENVARRYSKVTVVGQQQGQEAFGQVSESGEGGPAAINTLATLTDPAFPFYKPYVAIDNNDARSPRLHAQMLLEKMRYEGFALHYRVPGHAQNGANWTVNSLCHVSDEVLKVDGDYLVYGRSFEMSKETGVITTLRLGYPGIVQ